MVILPLSRTEYDVNTLRKAMKTGLGIQSENVKPLILLNEIFGNVQGQDHVRMMRESGVLLEHIFQSFVCALGKELLFDFMEISDVHVITTESLSKSHRFCILSGTLAEWKHTICCACCDYISFDLRRLGQELLKHFDALGYRGVFTGYSRIDAPDGTLILEEKK